MKLHRNAKTTPTSRLELVRRAVYDGWRYQAVAEGYGVSVRTVAKWVQRFRQLGVAGLEDGSSWPQQTPHITPPIRVTFIRQLREHHGLPAWVIARALRMPRLAGRSSRPDLRRVSRAGHHLVCRAPHHDPSRHERQREWLCVPGLSRRLCRSDASPSTDTALHATNQRESGALHSDAPPGMGVRTTVCDVWPAPTRPPAVAALLQSRPAARQSEL